MLLREKNPDVALRDVLTIFARREDIAAVFGMTPPDIEATMNALSLGVDQLEDWDLSHEIPTDFYIDFGKDFVLLPCFGALSNPYFALFRHLRIKCRPDWDRAVDHREAIFRSDLTSAFPAPRFIVPNRGFILRRTDGSRLTDIDAVVFDKNIGRVALVQLKWHDIFGRLLTERESRRRNLEKANEWVARVFQWVGERSSQEVAPALGVTEAGSDPRPELIVISRYSARFSGEHQLDSRAIWLAWPELLGALAAYGGVDPLGELSALVDSYREPPPEIPDMYQEFRFRNLIVGLRVRGRA